MTRPLTSSVLVAAMLSGCFGPRTQQQWAKHGSAPLTPKSRSVGLTATCADATAGMLMPVIGDSTKWSARDDVCASGDMARAADQSARLELEFRGYVLEDAERINAETGNPRLRERTEVSIGGTQWQLSSTRDLKLFEHAPPDVQSRILVGAGIDAMIQTHVLVRPMYMLVDTPPAVDVAIVMMRARDRSIVWSARCHQESSDSITDAVRCAAAKIPERP